jgi:4-amino-4-deoxy-L-arabinose transferase-like glycosyltransferase
MASMPTRAARAVQPRVHIPDMKADAGQAAVRTVRCGTPNQSESAALARPDARSVTTSGRARDVASLALLLPVFVGVLAFVPPVYQRGEAREGLVVQSILAGGDPLVPRREGKLASKPPLFHWIAAGTARAIGPSDFALRVPSALGAWVMLVATFVAGMALFADRRRAWLGAGALASTVGFWRPAIEARVDMVFAGAIAVALAGFACWLRTARPAGRRVLYLGCAAATLAKGPAGVLLPGLVVAATLMGRRERTHLRELWDPVAMVAAAGAIVGWYVLGWQRAGSEFVAVHLVRENLDRAIGVGPFARQRAAHPLRMLGAFVMTVLPWNLALLGAWRRPASWSTRLLHAWWIVILVFFTIAAGKREVYLLPLYPAIALLAADRLADHGARRRWIPAAMVLLAVVTCVTTLALRRHDAARNRLRPFVEKVVAAVPATARVGVHGPVVENDRLILAYGLHRPVPRLRRGTTDFVVAQADATPAGCRVVVPWPRPADERRLALFGCSAAAGR